MCCIVCSRRGITYFGVTAHLVTGLLILPLISLTAAYAIGPNGSGKDLSPFDKIFLTVYTGGILILGFVIFRGIKQESLLKLKISTTVLLLFQTSSVIVTICCWKRNNGQEALGVVRIVSVVLSCMSTVFYVVTLVLFMRYIKKKMKKVEEPNNESDNNSEIYYVSP